MLIRYIQFKMQANSWLMLRCPLWGAFKWGLKKNRFTKPGSGSINLAFDWYQRYRKCLQRSKSRRISTYLRLSALWLEQVSEAVLLKKPSFRSYNSPVDTHSITLNRYCFSLMQMLPYPDARTGEWHCMRWNRGSIIWYQCCMPQPP